MLFTLGLLGWSFWAGNKPFLGLDLQGGVAVILTPSGEATDEQLEDAVTIIRSRVDAIGVAEPEITRQGQNISVEIPGVEDPQQAIELEHKKMLADARTEIARLVVTTTERVLAKKLTDGDRASYTEAAARELTSV